MADDARKKRPQISINAGEAPGDQHGTLSFASFPKQASSRHVMLSALPEITGRGNAIAPAEETIQVLVAEAQEVAHV